MGSDGTQKMGNCPVEAGRVRLGAIRARPTDAELLCFGH